MNLKNMIEDRLVVRATYRRLFDTSDGKVVLQHILRSGFVVSSTFVAGDSHKTALNEGSRRLALSILRFAKTNPQEVIKEIESEFEK